MPFNIDDFLKNSLLNLDYTKEITGIDDFLKSLEFHYFSTIKLKSKSCNLKSIHLVLEVNCNLDLLELLSHFNTGRWGRSDKSTSPLQQNLKLLNSKNSYNLDIEELTIFLNDTNIVIKRIYNNSISSQFNDILKQIACNYVFLTKGLTQKPYELFIPIFEDSIEDFEFENDQVNILPKSYYEFWGIYLDKDDEASIFDVQRNTYVCGDLEFLSE
ncbi:hypothetical protein [uncultured Maribacter sp.]|uniref:hypothetical protein n=1 Tax=uncultured Maribacter sp. TaxID=431308 RepID=UPI0030EF9518|tara:strand:- start:75116 stop:75760 length:645 start_codon:yes stop_codon:yes gene_type:complete